MAADCAALPTDNAGQRITSHCVPLLLWFPCKRWYLNVRTFNFFNLSVSVARFVSLIHGKDEKQIILLMMLAIYHYLEI